MAIQPTLHPTDDTTNTYIPTGKRFLQIDQDDPTASVLYRLADLRGCSVSEVERWRTGLRMACLRMAACLDGRLPHDDYRAVLIGGPVDALGCPKELLRDALKAKAIVCRWGHLYLPDFKRLYPIPKAHQRAKPARAKRDEEDLRLRQNEYQRKYAARIKVVELAQPAAKGVSIAAPTRPSTQVRAPKTTLGRSQEDLSKISGPSQIDLSPESAKSFMPGIPVASNIYLSPMPQQPQMPHDLSQEDLSKISAPLTDALQGISSTSSSKSPRLKSSVSTPSSPREVYKNPYPLGDSGFVHARMGKPQGPDPQPSPTSVAVPPALRTEGPLPDQLPKLDAIVPADVAPQQASLAPQAPVSLTPERFVQELRQLCINDDRTAEAERRAKVILGHDYAVIAGLGGIVALLTLSGDDRAYVVTRMCQKQARAHKARTEAAAEASTPMPSGELSRLLMPKLPHTAPPAPAELPAPPPVAIEPQQAAQTICEPTPAPVLAPTPRSLAAPPPMPDEGAEHARGEWAPRHRGEPKQILAAGAVGREELRSMIEADLQMPPSQCPLSRMLELQLSPERAQLALRDVARTKLHDPTKRGWAALSAMQRVAGTYRGDRPR